MRHVVLTGGIGCGKTTVLREFERLGVPWVVADDVAAGYYDDLAFVVEVDRLLGGGTMTADGRADKQAIASIVFGNREMLLRLNALIHPRVWNDYLRFAAEHADAPYCLFESAIAYEYGFDRLADAVVCVYVDKEERLRRLAHRDPVPGLSMQAIRERFEARMRNQLPAEEKMMRADYVVLNYEGNPRRRQVEYIHGKLCTPPLS